jgi:hypothetical protein
MHTAPIIWSNVLSKVAFCPHKLRSWLYSSVGQPARFIMRKWISTRVDLLPELPVYVVRSDNDLSLGRSLVEMSLKIVSTNSPLWRRRMNGSFKSLIIVDTVESAGYYISDKCCLVNPWFAARHVHDNTWASILIAGSIVRTLCHAMLLNGRFGYFGVKNQAILVIGAEIRFLRTLLGGENQTDILAAMSSYSDLIEKIQPGRDKIYRAMFERELERIRNGETTRASIFEDFRGFE